MIMVAVRSAALCDPFIRAVIIERNQNISPVCEFEVKKKKKPSLQAAENKINPLRVWWGGISPTA